MPNPGEWRALSQVRNSRCSSHLTPSRVLLTHRCLPASFFLLLLLVCSGGQGEAGCGHELPCQVFILVREGLANPISEPFTAAHQGGRSQALQGCGLSLRCCLRVQDSFNSGWIHLTVARTLLGVAAMQQRAFGEASLGSLSMTLPSMPRSVLCGHPWQRMGDISRAISFLVPAHQKTQVCVK